MLNTSILMGRLTADPELKYTQSDVPVASFTLAVDRTYKSGEEKKTDFINIVAWRQRAEFVTKWFKKGSLVVIEGAIQTRKYQDKDGSNKTVFEVVANNVHFGGGNVENKGNNPSGQKDPLDAFEEKLEDVDSDERLPF